MINWLDGILDSSGFRPFGHCYLWQEDILLLQIVGNGGMALAFLVISFELVKFVKLRKDLAFSWVFVLFSVFIFSCAMTHLMHVVTIWSPLFRFDALIRIATSAFSITAAVILWRLIPKALQLPSPALLVAKNGELQGEIEERKKVEQELLQIKADLEIMVNERTRALRASEEKLLMLVDGIDRYGLFLLDKEGCVASWNSGAERITGYAKDEAMGSCMDFLLKSEDQASGAFEGELEGAVLHNAVQNERWLIKKDGTEFWASVTTHALKNEEGSVRGFAKVLADETARREVEMSLRKSEAKFRAMTESLPQLIWSALPNGSANYFNSRWIQYTGSIMDANIGSGWLDCLHADDRGMVMQKWKGSTDTGDVYETEARIRKYDGLYEWHLIKGYALRGDKGEIIKWLGTCTNIEAQKQAEQHLQKAMHASEQASQAKSQFLANMSHEIRTPLGAMLGFVELLKDPQLSPQERDDFIEIISRNGENLVALIDDILDLARVEAGHVRIKREPVDLSLLIKDVTSLLGQKAKEKGISLETSMSDGTPKVIETDSLRLRQILINIIGNAIKFTKKGRVAINVRLKAESGSQILEFLVEDTGIGIASEYQKQLFQSFSQADYKSTRRFGGAGLGLALSKRLAERLGGDVSLIKSVEGEGTIFSIEIDPGDSVVLRKLQSCNLVLTSSASPEAQDRLEGAKILVVEDAPDNQALINYLLTRQGAEVEIAENGREAMIKAVANDFDLIFMDIQMPVMDGIETVQRLREINYRTPIVALTAHAFHDEKVRCLKAGFNDHLTKPINERRLVEIAASYLRRR